MRIEIEKLTGLDLLHEAIQFTSGHRFEPKCGLLQAYAWGHSLTRTQIFIIKMYDIPTAVSIHFVRHKIGVEHFVKSNRPDRGGDSVADRNTPVNHMMLLNAEALINIAHKRLCYQASKETRETMEMIKFQIQSVDHALYKYLVPQCIYRNGICPEPKSCGLVKIYFKGA